MKWFVHTAVSGILMFLVIGCGGGSSTPVTPDLSIQVISPNGNEQWEPGDEHEISWTSNISSGSVLIEYSNDGFASDINTIATVPAVDGTYLWFVPDDASPSVRVRISSSDMPSVSDMSDAGFTIVQPELKILSPRGGEEFKVGRECQIEWTTEYPNSAVLIEYSTDNFVDDIQFIATDFVPGIPMGNYNGAYSWKVDCSPSQLARIRVSIHEKRATMQISPEFKILHSGWAESWGTNKSEYPGGIDVDASGNIYISGKMGNQNGTENAFLAKYTTSSQLVWAKTWCEVASGRSWDVRLDTAGNIFVTGYFSGTGDFNPGPGTSMHTSNGKSDAFLCKFNNSGELVWSRSWGGDWFDDGHGVAIDGSGDIYVTGYFNNTVDFNPGTGSDNHTSWGLMDCYLSKFDTNGNFLWAGTWGGSGGDVSNAVASDSSGGIYVTGEFRETVDFDPGFGSVNHTSNGYRDAFLSKFTISGSHLWVHVWGGESDEKGNDLAVDQSNNVYVIGSFGGAVDFNPGPGVDNKFGAGLYDAYLIRFASNQAYHWVLTWGGSGEDLGMGVTVDSVGNCLVTGSFHDTVDMNPGAGADYHVAHGPSSDYDAFLTRFDNTGAFQWSNTWGGTHRVSGVGVAASSSNTPSVIGYYEGVANLAPSDAPCYEAAKNFDAGEFWDGFVIMFRATGCW